MFRGAATQGGNSHRFVKGGRRRALSRDRVCFESLEHRQFLSTVSPDTQVTANANLSVQPDLASSYVWNQHDEVRSNADSITSSPTFQTAADSDGNYALVWMSYETGYGYRLHARSYDAAGVPRGAEVEVGTAPVWYDEFAVATGADGNFTIVWSSGEDIQKVYARRFDNTGAPQGAGFLVSAGSSRLQSDPWVSADAEGNFVVVWCEREPNGHNLEILGQRFDSQGAPLGQQFSVGSDPNAYYASSRVSMAPDGRFVAAWYGADQQHPGSYVIEAQRFDASGVAQGNSIVLSGVAFHTVPQIESDAAGNFIISTGSALYRFNSAGVQQGDVILAGGSNVFTTIAMGANGDFITITNTFPYDVSVKRYSAAGVLQDISRVNKSRPARVKIYQTAVKIDASGNFTVFWDYSFSEPTPLADILVSRKFEVVSEDQAVSISGRVWIDSNGDGIKAPGEFSQLGQLVRLFLSDGTEINNSTSDLNGTSAYRFYIPEGLSVYVGFEPLAHNILTRLHAGSDPTLDNDIDPTTHKSDIFAGVAGQEFVRDIGFASVGSVQGTIYSDSNGSDTRNRGEVGAAGLVVFADYDNDGVLDNDEAFGTTDSGGLYRLTNMLPGDYRLVVKDQPQWLEPSPRDISVVENGTTTVPTLKAVPRVAAALAGGILKLQGSSESDAINIQLLGKKIHVTWAISPAVAGSFDFTASAVNQIQVLCGDGNDTVVVGPSVPKACLMGGNGNDSLTGGAGDDSIYGEAGNDRLFGGTGNDLIDGGADNDRLEGQDGRDRMNGGPGNDVLLGGNHNDNLFGDDGDDSIDGGGENDRLTGGAGADTLRGNIGDDVFYSRDGFVDVIDGGAGDDSGDIDRKSDLKSLLETMFFV